MTEVNSYFQTVLLRKTNMTKIKNQISDDTLSKQLLSNIAVKEDNKHYDQCKKTKFL